VQIERAIRKTDAEGRVVGKADILARMLADLKKQYEATPNAEDRWAIDKAIERCEYWIHHKPKRPGPATEERQNTAPILTATRSDSSGNTTGNDGWLGGYAAVFNSLSLDLGGFFEKILPGAFAKSLAASADVLGLLNHEANHVLGRTSAKTLILKEDSRGLAFQLRPGGSQLWRDTLDQVQRRDLARCSFAFAGPVDRFKVQPDGSVIREISDVGRLVDVSIVTTPAYEQTSVSIFAGGARSIHPDVQFVELSLWLMKQNDPSKRYPHLIGTK
jgi:HK97 family phage prohead protease